MPTRRRTSAGSLILSVVATVAAIAIVGGLIYFKVWSSGQALRPDGCSSNGPDGLLVIGVDATDELSGAQRLDVQNKLEIALEEADANWRVEVWNIAPVSGVAVMTGSAECVPPRDAGPLVANPARVKARSAQFSAKMRALVTQAVSTAPSSGSPILESLQAIGIRAFGAPEAASIRGRRLLLVTDFLQHTPAVSFLHGVPKLSEFQGSKRLETLRASLSGVRVDVLFLSRPGVVPSGSLIEWWQQYFASSGASITSVHRIVG